MWKLIIEDDEGKQTSLPLAHAEYGLGRAENNSIRLTDRNVSRRHAGLRKNGQGWVVHDLQSYNGTYVNGVRVAGDHPVSSGDIVQLGDYRLEFLDEATTAAAQAEQAAQQQLYQRPDRLVVVVGPTPGAEYPLDRESFSIGRAEEATISINHTSVSRLHAELYALGNGRYEIVDKGSANGIRINGVELRRGILEAGDALELGDVRMRFVGRGKVFRTTTDQSQQLAAVGFESVAPHVRGAQAKGGNGKWIGIGAGLGLALVAFLAVVAMKPAGGQPQPSPGASVQMAVDPGPAMLKAAVDLLKTGDLEAAHKKVLEIPETSAARDAPEFQDIEGKWADSIFAKIELSTEQAEKKNLLLMILKTTTVDSERRKKAAEMWGTIAPEEKVPEAYLRPPPPGGYQPGGPFPGSGQTAPPPPTKTADPVPVPTVPPGGVMDDEATRRNLAPKAWAGKASLGELKMLRAACRNLGDTTCRDRAAAMIKKKMEENQ